MFRLGLHESSGDDVVAAALENYLRERLGWRAVEDGAVGRGKHSTVARAGEDVFRGAVKYRAGVVRAEAAEGEIGVFSGTQQEAGTVVGWISENLRAADWNFFSLRDNFYRVGRFVLLPISYQRARDGKDSGNAEPFVEAAASDRGSFFSLWPVVVGFVDVWLL